MNWVISFLIAFLTGVVGLLCVGFLGNACVGWYRISPREGGAGYFVVFLALIGAIASLIVGFAVALLLRSPEGSPPFLKALGCACGIVMVLTGLAAIACRLLADIPPTLEGRQLTLDVEIRLPAGETNPLAIAPEKSYLNLESVVNLRRRQSWLGEMDKPRARQENGRWILPGAVFLHTSRGLRLLEITLNGTFREGFIVPLPPRPGKEFEAWSDWLPRDVSKDQPWPDSKISYRFRIQRIGPPPPAPAAP